MSPTLRLSAKLRMSVNLSTSDLDMKLAREVVLQGSTKLNTNSPVEPQIWSETQYDSKRNSFI